MKAAIGGATDKNARICIVGAGAAGLSAAWYLRQRGYNYITILEKSDRPGGKCRSLTVDGVSIELGAALVMPDYRRVLAVAAEVGAAMRPIRGFRALRHTVDGVEPRTIRQLVIENHGFAATAAAAWRYPAEHRRHASVMNQPGFAGMGTGSPGGELSQPFGSWARDRGMEPLVTLFQLPVTAFGYGDLADLPAGYVMRYIGPRLFLAMALSPLFVRTEFLAPRRFEDGHGDFFASMSRGFDLRLNAHVESVRRGTEVSVVWEERQARRTIRRSETFDKLILACPVAATARFLDQSLEEQRLFEQVRTRPYSVTVCDTEGIPTGLYFLETQSEAGHVIQFWRPSPDSGACVFYTRPSEGMSAGRIAAGIRDSMGSIYPGAMVGRVLSHSDWNYFPHVDVEAFKAGFFDDFEALQGSRATWYCGSLPAFESVENVFAYSETMVERLVAGHTGNEQANSHLQTTREFAGAALGRFR